MGDRKRLPGHMVSDLGRKAGDDAQRSVLLTMALCEHPDDGFVIATMACAPILGLAVGASARGVGAGGTPEQLVDALWSILRPAVLKACGGSSAEFQQLLRDTENARG